MGGQLLRRQRLLLYNFLLIALDSVAAAVVATERSERQLSVAAARGTHSESHK